MKVLMLSQARKIEDQPDYDASFRHAKMFGEPVELKNIPFISYIEQHGPDAFYEEIIRQNDTFKPDLIFFQFFHSANPGDPRPCVARLRAMPNKPLIFGSVGDPFHTGLRGVFSRRLPKSLVQLASVADAFFSTSMGCVSRCLVRHGARNVVFLPNAFCPCHFPLPDVAEKNEKKYDVVLLGSYTPMFAPRFYGTFKRGYLRYATVHALLKRFGERFALFGRGWSLPCARGSVPFKEQLEVFKASRVAVDVPAHVDDTYYTSDRAFFIASSGTPLVMRHIDRLEKMFRPEENVYFAKRVRDIPDVCEHVLSLDEATLRVRREKTLTLIKERHLIDHRIDTIVSVAEAIIKHRKGEMDADAALRHLRLWHFLPEVDLEEERRYAVENWRG